MDEYIGGTWQFAFNFVYIWSDSDTYLQTIVVDVQVAIKKYFLPSIEVDCPRPRSMAAGGLRSPQKMLVLGA